MKSIRELGSADELPPAKDIVAELPRSWQGMTIGWKSGSKPVPVFLEKFLLADDASPTYLFGIRHELEDLLLDGQQLGPGYFLEFVVATRRDGNWRMQRLLQNESVTFSALPEANDYTDKAVELSRQPDSYVRKPPEFRGGDAIWPTLDGRPMVFVGQLELPKTELTRQLLTWDVTVYLYCTRNGNADIFKIVMQDHSGQTAEEHYAQEDG